MYKATAYSLYTNMLHFAGAQDTAEPLLVWPRRQYLLRQRRGNHPAGDL